MNKVRSAFLLLIAGLITSLALAAIINFGIVEHFKYLGAYGNELRYTDSLKRFQNHDALVDAMGPKTITVLGSSELLNPDTNFETHPSHLLNGTNLNMLAIGKGGTESLVQTITLGSIANSLPNKQINLILSMQWFEPNSVVKTRFQSRMSLDHLYYFLNNPRISAATKSAVMKRVYQLTDNNPIYETNVKVIDLSRSGNPFGRGLAAVWHWQNRVSLNISTWQDLLYFDTAKPHKITGKFDWEALRQRAVKDGEKHSRSNQFYFNDDAYRKMTAHQNLSSYQGSDSKLTFDYEPEFADLELFLQTAQDLGLHVNLFSVPIPQKWAEYTKVPQSSIDRYRAHIHRLADKYHATLFDYQKYAGAPYFFKDSMHVGRVGWAYILPDLLEANGFGSFNGKR